jgi:hypothetical protein
MPVYWYSTPIILGCVTRFPGSKKYKVRVSPATIMIFWIVTSLIRSINQRVLFRCYAGYRLVWVSGRSILVWITPSTHHRTQGQAYPPDGFRFFDVLRGARYRERRRHHSFRLSGVAGHLGWKVIWRCGVDLPKAGFSCSRGFLSFPKKNLKRKIISDC